MSKEMPDKHSLCGGGEFCTSGDKHCTNVAVARKVFALGHVPGNISLICCFVAQSLNRKGIQGLGGKIKPSRRRSMWVWYKNEKMYEENINCGTSPYFSSE